MQIPLEISFHGVSRSEWSENFIREQAKRLERFCDHIISCRVVVEQPHHHRHHGNPYRVRVEVRIPPNKDLVATEEPKAVDKDSELHPVILNAFKKVERQIKSALAARRAGVHIPVAEEAQALVERLFVEEGYGFIRTPEGREIYFHQHSVLNDDFMRLTVGIAVHFEEAMGENGPQAIVVQIVKQAAIGVGIADDLEPYEAMGDEQASGH